MFRGLLPIFVVVAAVAPAAQQHQIEAVEVRCPSVLGVGFDTEVPFCDVQVQRDPSLGILVVLSPRSGEATLSFNLHNRHTYSEQEERGGRAYTKYLASIAVANMEGVILGRGVVLSEFRSAADLIDRVTGGAGPSGVKAIAPTGSERVYVSLPPDVDQVSIVGQSLEVERAESRDTFRSLGRPVAVLSDARLEYHPR